MADIAGALGAVKDSIAGNDGGATLRSAGTAFADSMKALPVGDMVQSIAMGIVKAQADLDGSAIKLLQAYGAQTLDIWGDSGGAQKTSMLALGLVPSFLSFQRVNIKVVMELSFHEDQSNQGSFNIAGNYGSQTTPSAAGAGDATAGTSAGGTTGGTAAGAAPASSPTTPKTSTLAVGASVSMSSARKFAMDMSGLAEVTAEMVSVPPPTQILEAITNRLRPAAAA